MKSYLGVLAALVVVLTAGMVWAQIPVTQVTEIQVIDSSVNCSYNAVSKTLSYSASGGTSEIFTDGVDFYPGLGFLPVKFSFDNCAITANYVLDDDRSSSGVMSGWFTSGTWSMDLRDSGHNGGNSSIIYAEGTLDWFSQNEDPENQTVGEGILNITTLNIDYGFNWKSAEAINWGGALNKAGLETEVLNYISGLPLEDYSRDFTSNSVAYRILPDETAIPEPATMILLGLGSVAMLRRR